MASVCLFQMGNAHIDGEVDGDLTVVMGTASLGAASVVTGDVTVVGGALNRAAGSRVDGSIHHVGSGGPAWSGSIVPEDLREGIVRRFGSLVGTLFRVGFLAFMALAPVALGRTPVERVADRAAADAVRAGLIGLAAQILFVPLAIVTVVVLVVSIVGIPLLMLIPFITLIALAVLVVGFTGVAYHIGRLLSGRFGWKGRGDYVTVLVGLLAVVGLTLFARAVALAFGGFFGWPLSAAGYLVEYAAWTLGLGAAILALPTRRRTPPPIPG